MGIPEGVTLLLLLWTIGFGVVFAVGRLLFVTVERPCINWAKRPARQGPPGAEVIGAAKA